MPRFTAFLKCAIYRVEVLAELADVVEVVRSLATVHGYSFQDVLVSADAKRIERGGFEGRNYVIFAEHPVGSFGEAYCLANPSAYPEMYE